MNDNVFTEHIRRLLADEADDGREAILRLRKSIVVQLKRMGQWHLPPRYLGYDGAAWDNSDALDELVQDAYLACIFERLTKLAEHLRASGTVEGCVHQKLTWFLQDCQRKGNPIGRRVFHNVRTASESLVDGGNAKTSESGRFTNSTVILALGAPKPSSREHLGEYFAAQLGDRDFVLGACRESVASWKLLESTILEKFDAGLLGYQLGDLVNLLLECGNHPREVVEPDLDGGAERKGDFTDLLPDLRTLRPEGRYQEGEDLQELLRTLTEHATTTLQNPRIQARVLRTLALLEQLIRQGEDPRQLKQAEIARRLGVSTSTLGEDFARLRTSNLMQDASKAASKS